MAFLHISRTYRVHKNFVRHCCPKFINCKPILDMFYLICFLVERFVFLLTFVVCPFAFVFQFIANRVTQAKQTIPHYFLTVEVNVEELLR